MSNDVTLADVREGPEWTLTRQSGGGIRIAATKDGREIAALDLSAETWRHLHRPRWTPTVDELQKADIRKGR